jgi:hypothetical protein
MATRAITACETATASSEGTKDKRQAAATLGALHEHRADVAQLVEHFTRNEGVGSSSLPVGSPDLQSGNPVSAGRLRVGLLAEVVVAPTTCSSFQTPTRATRDGEHTAVLL